MSGLSFWNIEQGLADLFEQREEALAELQQFTPESDTRLEQIDFAIAAYMKAEVLKVDNVCGYWRDREMRIAAGKAEKSRISGLIESWERQLIVLKNAIQITMEEMQWRAGKPRKLEGKTGSISLVGNGGRRPVVITDESLIPDEYRTVTVKMNAELWRKVCAALPDLAGMQECRKEPNLTLIYNALESGMDGVPGAVLAPLGSHVRVK